MPSERPANVGHYQILEDLEAPDASVRVIQMTGAEEVECHVHQRSAQIYVALVGKVVVLCDGEETVLEPYRAFPVPRQSSHGVKPYGHGPAVVLNVSVPPLEADDQVPTLSPAQAATVPPLG